MAVEYDEIGIWSEVKLAIIREYASAYSTIVEAQRRQKIPSLKWLYIDAYAGPGLHLSKTSGDIVVAGIPPPVDRPSSGSSKAQNPAVSVSRLTADFPRQLSKLPVSGGSPELT